MERRPSGSRTAAIAAAVLLVLGGLAAFASVAWWKETRYVASISAPDGVPWILWIPQADPPMPVAIEGSAVVEGSVSTTLGPLLNVTGTGSARLRFAASSIGFGADPFDIGPHVNLTGRNGTWPAGVFRVWRAAVSPEANVTLSGGIGWTAQNLHAQYNCGGSGFLGDLQQGWNDLPVGFGDCAAILTSIPGLIPAVLLIPGAVLGAREARRRRKRTV